MKIRKNTKTGAYYAHLYGSNPINLKTSNLEDAKRLAADAKLEELEHAAKANALTSETITRLMAGGRKVNAAQAVKTWEEWADLVGLTPATVYRYKAAIEQFLRDFKFETKSLSAVAERDIDHYVNPRCSETSLSTRRNRLAALQSFFTVAARHGYVVGDPASIIRINMDRMTFEQKEPHRREIFNPDELDKLRAVDDKFWGVAIEMANKFGLRMGDVASLEWSQFTQDQIVVWTDKHDKRLVFPMDDEVRAMLERIPKRSTKYLFPEEREIAHDPSKRAMLSVYFSRLLDRLGIEGKSFHCLRHTFATRHATLGRSIDEIRIAMGHSNNATTEGYIHK